MTFTAVFAWIWFNLLRKKGVREFYRNEHVPRNGSAGHRRLVLPLLVLYSELLVLEEKAHPLRGTGPDSRKSMGQHNLQEKRRRNIKMCVRVSIILQRSRSFALSELKRAIHWRKYPKEKVVGMYHFDEPVLLLRDPELVYKVYVTDFHSFEDNAYAVDEEVDPVFGKSVFFQKGDKWKKSRKMLSPAFTIGRIKMIFDQLTCVAEKLNEYIEKHPEETEVSFSNFKKETGKEWKENDFPFPVETPVDQVRDGGFRRLRSRHRWS